jgi:hypothetical protein
MEFAREDSADYNPEWDQSSRDIIALVRTIVRMVSAQSHHQKEHIKVCAY